jgi:NTP pyrophosphatase (non-canonical NTP hydrolase)
MDSRRKIYEDALIRYGRNNQLVVAIEELSELQKEICKYFRHEGKHQDLIEEVADVSIMLEQIIYIFDIDEDVKKVMQEKVQRLKGRING